MKQVIAIILLSATLLLCGCDTDISDNPLTTDVPIDAPTTAAPAVTDKKISETVAVTTSVPETKPETTPTDTEPGLPDVTKDFTIPYSEVNNSGNKSDLNAVISYGEWVWDDTAVTVKDGPAIAVVCNDCHKSGEMTLTANITSLAGSDVNDNGIIFGLDESVLTNEDERYFFEDGAAYYFLFVNDGGSLHLAKVNYDGTVWEDFGASNPLPDYTHGDTFEISVVYDGEGYIMCYFNDELIMSYQDDLYLTGRAYGIRAESIGVKYNGLKVEYLEY